FPTVEGGGESWPHLDVVSGSEVMHRIRSATLHYGDALPARRWSGDAFAAGFFAMTASDATEGPGWERVQYTWWNAQSDYHVPLVLPPAPGDRWFQRTASRGPIPHPVDPSLVALGRLEAARFQPYAYTSGRGSQF